MTTNMKYTLTVHIKDNETGKTADITISNETPEKLVRGLAKMTEAAAMMMNMSDEDLKTVGEMIKTGLDEKKSK